MKENREGIGQVSYPRFLSSMHRGTVVHIRASRKIDKKRRFVKCRGRFGLLAATDPPIEERGSASDSHSWVLTHCSSHLL
jgi:hypothetical protein